MKLIVGLGNPETKYNGTRHNIGFEVADAIARELKCDFKAGKGDYYFAKSAYQNHDLIIQKPTTYMNLSGHAVRYAMQFYKISISDVLVICDDFAIALGAIRLREKGSDGGQNGLKNIIQELGRDDFARLRFGIGNINFKGDASSFVLGKFTPEELPIVKDSIHHATKAALSFIEQGINITMTRFNRKESNAIMKD